MPNRLRDEEEKTENKSTDEEQNTVFLSMSSRHFTSKVSNEETPQVMLQYIQIRLLLYRGHVS